MKQWILTTIVLIDPYFLQKSFFVMLINNFLAEKHSRISKNKNVNNSTVFTFVLSVLECNRLCT